MCKSDVLSKHLNKLLSYGKQLGFVALMLVCYPVFAADYSAADVESGAAVEETQRLLNAAEELRQAQAKADEAQAAADALKQEFMTDRDMTSARFEMLLQEQRVRAERRENIMLAVAILLFGGMVVGFFLIRARSSSPMVRAHAESAALGLGDEDLMTVMNRSMSEYILDGRDEDGIRYLLRISGDQLSKSEGVVIGRNPKDSPFIINHGDVSRKHARMKAVRSRVFIEDLGSTNGTSVNGQSIDSKGPVSVANGDQVIIGSVVMKLRVLND